MKKLYPSWRYHPTLPPRIVQDPAEDAALGPLWAKSPAAVAAAPAEPPSGDPVIPEDDDEPGEADEADAVDEAPKKRRGRPKRTE